MEENFNSKKRKQSGLVRVGKLKWDFNKKRDIIPKVEGFVPVIIKNYKYGLGHTLSPYFLKDENGCIMENVWQFSKVYPKIYTYLKNDPSEWVWCEEEHIKDDQVQDEYWKWRESGMKHPKPIRYPNQRKHRQECAFALWKNDNSEWERYNYIDSRKIIYSRVYADLAKREKEYTKLKQMLDDGKNLLLLDVDGPSPGDTAPFTNAKDFTLEINEQTGLEWINNPNQPWPHCAVLACCLLDIEHIWDI